MTRQYSLPKSALGTDRGDPRGMAPYIRETAKKYGIDPEVALRVAKSEGLSSFRSGVRTKSGGEEPSFGAFQLYTGGGLGNQFQKETGLDPSDPKNEKATIDYALKTAAKVGWGPWHGAKNTGIGQYEGISGAGTQTQTASTGTEPASADAAIKGTRTSTETPDVVPAASAAASGGATGDFLSKLQDQKGAAATGLGEAISGLGQAVAGTGLNKGLYATAPARVAPVPVAPTPAPPAVVPTVDPRAAENQRQQLAMAIQRLNSGRLY
jgi:hypothetical protein